MFNRTLAILLGLVFVAGPFTPAGAAQLGAGLHYLHTIDDLGGADEISQDDFSVFGSVTIPLLLARVEGDLEWVPDYLGSSESLIQPTAWGLMPFGMLYGGIGVGIGYLTGDNAGWASNPFYALRAGAEFGLAGFSLDAFATYRFQSASFVDETANMDLDALTVAAQIKFDH